MPFERGKNKTGGRQKGTVNRSTAVARQFGVQGWADLQGYMEGRGLQRCISELEGLDGKDFVDAYGKISEFVKPKLARAEILAKVETNVTWREERTYEEPKMPANDNL